MLIGLLCLCNGSGAWGMPVSFFLDSRSGKNSLCSSGLYLCLRSVPQSQHQSQYGRPQSQHRSHDPVWMLTMRLIVKRCITIHQKFYTVPPGSWYSTPQPRLSSFTLRVSDSGPRCRRDYLLVAG